MEKTIKLIPNKKIIRTATQRFFSINEIPMQINAILMRIRMVFFNFPGLKVRGKFCIVVFNNSNVTKLKMKNIKKLTLQKVLDTKFFQNFTRTDVMY